MNAPSAIAGTGFKRDGMKNGKFFWGLIAITGWFAILLQFSLSYPKFIDAGRSTAGAIVQFLSYFTILTNLMVVVTLTVLLTKPSHRWAVFFARPSVSSGIVLYMTIVGIVYNLVLRQLWKPEGIDRLADELLHLVQPVLYLLFWLILVPKGSLKPTHILYWLFYPLVYTPYVMIRGAISGHYPYPFLDINENGFMKVVLNMLLIAAAFIVLGSVFYFVDRTMGKSRKRARVDNSPLQ